MAVTIDTSAKSTGGIDVTTQTISITVGNNANRLLIVGGGAGGNSSSNRTISSVSSNVDGSFGTNIGGGDDANWTAARMFKLVNPTVGAHTITVTWTGQVRQGLAMAISLYDVDQTTPVGTVTSVSGTVATTAPTGAVTLASGDMAVGFICTDSENTLTNSVGTERQKTLNIDGDTAYSLATNTGTGSTSITWATASEKYAAIVAPIKVAGASSSSPARTVSVQQAVKRSSFY